MRDDAELLRQYVQAGSEDAFAELVQRHLPVVYSSALRQTEGDVELAKDICQTVFIDFGRKAGSLLGHELLIGWLFSATRFAAATALRANRRRQIRERIAVSMHEDAATPALECRDPKLASALDAAMEELTSEDRNAVLLRFFQGKDFKDVGGALGLTEDAARMRVSRAIGKLHSLLESRGVTVSAAALGSILSTEAVTAVPAGLAATISAAALSGTAITTTAVIAATKAIAMTTLQKTVITAVFAAIVGTGIYEARQAANARAEVQTLQQQQAPLIDQIKQLQSERDDATNRLVSLADGNRSETELLKLRDEVTRLRMESQEVAKLKAGGGGKAIKSLVEEAESLLNRVSLLKHRLEQTPEARIPELQFLSEDDWLRVAARPKQLDTDEDFRAAFSDLRNRAEGDFLRTMEPALLKYIEANNNHFPTDLSQLTPYVVKPAGDDILQRYQIVSASSVPESGGIIAGAGDMLITLKDPLDGKVALGRSGVSELNDSSGIIAILAPAMRALAADTPEVDGKKTMDIHQLAPYLKTPEQKAAYEKLMQQSK
jgi:RNA polymerase sigma factor (sigma-70 family)